jgi:hypothetical protein
MPIRELAAVRPIGDHLGTVSLPSYLVTAAAIGGLCAGDVLPGN